MGFNDMLQSFFFFFFFLAPVILGIIIINCHLWAASWQSESLWQQAGEDSAGHQCHFLSAYYRLRAVQILPYAFAALILNALINVVQLDKPEHQISKTFTRFGVGEKEQGWGFHSRWPASALSQAPNVPPFSSF